MLELLEWTAPHFPGAAETDANLIVRWKEMIQNSTPRWEQILRGHYWTVEEADVDEIALDALYGE